MRIKFPSLFLILLLVAVGCSKISGGAGPGGDGPLRVQLPAGWHLDYQVQKGLDLYVLNSAEQGVMMFSPWEENTRSEDMPSLVRQSAQSVVDGISDTGAVRLASKEIKVEAFTGKYFSGQYVSLAGIKGTDKVILAVFMFSDGFTVWGGQFTGKTDEWLNALAMLKTLQPP
jgi:hypothetical protein